MYFFPSALSSSSPPFFPPRVFYYENGKEKEKHYRNSFKLYATIKMKRKAYLRYRYLEFLYFNMQSALLIVEHNSFFHELDELSRFIQFSTIFFFFFFCIIMGNYILLMIIINNDDYNDDIPMFK